MRYVVALSSVGADLSEGTGVIAGLHAQEERLKRIDGTNVLLLRPVSFFENFYDALAIIQHEEVNADSVAPDLAVPIIASRDIADVAAGEPKSNVANAGDEGCAPPKPRWEDRSIRARLQ